MPSPTAHTGGNFNFEYVTANGGSAQQTRINAQRGINGAAMLLGAGLWTVRPGANVLPYFSQEYFAVYSQNDWRPTSKLTINLGLRWEVQPGPTERENRMSAWDFTKMNPFGTQGAVAFPGEDGYSRNLWDTEYNNWGPRVGAAYTMIHSTVVRGGFGITYLPSNTGYFSGPTDYGRRTSRAASRRFPTARIPAAWSPASSRIRRQSSTRSAAIRPRRRSTASASRASPASSRTAARRSGTCSSSGRSGTDWTASAGYTASLSRNLLNRSFPIQNLQSIDPAVLAAGATYIASNGTVNPATQLVPNPISRDRAAAAVRRRARRGDDCPPDDVLPVSTAGPRHRQQLGRERRLPRHAAPGQGRRSPGPDARREPIRGRGTWRTRTPASMTGRASTPAAPPRTGTSTTARKLDIGLSDVPHRLVATFLYQVPLSIKGQASAPTADRESGRRRLASRRLGDLADRLPNRHQRCEHGCGAGAPGSCRRRGSPAARESVGLVRRPDGGDAAERTRDHASEPHLPQIQPRCVRRPRGDHAEWGDRGGTYWYGNASQTCADIRTDSRFNIDISLRRDLPLAGYRLEFGVDMMNVLNHTEFSGAYAGGLGGAVTAPSGAGLVPGMGNATNFGTRGMAT